MATRQLGSAALAFLRERRFGVLATINRNGTPQQSVVWYDLDGDEILMNTRAGRIKDRNLRRDPRCSLCVEEANRYVTIRGTATLTDDQTVAQRDIERLATRYDGRESAARQMRSQFSAEDRVTIRLAIEQVKEYGL